MTRRTPVFTEQHLAQLRTQLSSLGAEPYWQGLPRLRLDILLATVCNPEFASAAFGDEQTAVQKWGHSLPDSISPAAVREIAQKSLAALDEQQSSVALPTFEGFEALLREVDEQLPQRLALLPAGEPLCIVVRGLSGSGKSSLAEIIARLGLQAVPEVGSLTADTYLSRAGRDSKSKITAYRRENGELQVVEPIKAPDPLSTVRALLWKSEFAHDYRSLAENHRVVVVDGGYGELLLDEIGVPTNQRFVVEVWLDSGARFEQLRRRIDPSLPADRQTVRLMNDVIVSMAWYSLLMEKAPLPDAVVYPLPSDNLEAVIARRSQLLGRPARPLDAEAHFLRQFNVARDPSTDRMNIEAFKQVAARVLAALPKTVSGSQDVSELHRTLPVELAKQVTAQQLQLLLSAAHGAGTATS